MRVSAAAVAIAVTLLACDPSPEPAPGTAAASLRAVVTHPRATLTTLDADTLADSARVTRLLPAPDGGAVAYVLDDPARARHGVLAVVTPTADRPRMVWPDGVRDAWWTTPQTLAFTTQAGARATVDVRADSFDVAPVLDSLPMSPPAATAPPADDTPARARVTAYVDSVYVQPGGQPTSADLRYQVRHVLVSPDRTLAAVYVAGSDAAGRTVNPAWYAVDPRTGAVFPMDQVVGPVAELPQAAGAWTETGQFLYAKGLRLWEAAFTMR
ncbi:MAG TPA: hypothetical protein VHQ45_03095 [Gemmatimonadaceae bacterium]|jgi:hypothetical protein|nr:hypothetical protein [Gemmatimonadaceae bacterium]